MNTHVYTGHELTKDEIKALRSRHLDSVCFDWFPDEKKAQIRVNLKTGDGFEKTVYVECDAVLSYVADEFRGQEPARAFALKYGYDAEWQTVARSLRAGDVVELVWMESGGNGYLGGALTTVKSSDGNGYTAYKERLYWDQLKIRVRRGKYPNEKTWQWHVDDSLCPNNSAKMIRRR